MIKRSETLENRLFTKEIEKKKKFNDKRKMTLLRDQLFERNFLPTTAYFIKPTHLKWTTLNIRERVFYFGTQP